MYFYHNPLSVSPATVAQFHVKLLRMKVVAPGDVYLESLPDKYGKHVSLCVCSACINVWPAQQKKGHMETR